MTNNAILNISALGFPWQTTDPFLFCAYHDDAYPAGNGQMGPTASLLGRDIGQDFSRKDGWSMYLGQQVPGFPAHPHRGFETVTIVRKGLIDHADSLGASARFGAGDTQWLTAGAGIVHSEMFPLLEENSGNSLELFQIWINLPAQNKMVTPHFTMFWSESIPHRHIIDNKGRRTDISIIAGPLQANTAEQPTRPLSPPPNSWAMQAEAEVAIWTLRMDPFSCWTLPSASSKQIHRNLYFFKGENVDLNHIKINGHARITLQGDASIIIKNGPKEAEFLLLQGRPIGEPVTQYGPFVMNTKEEISQAVSDYRVTNFGDWPWDSSAPVHGPNNKRFAIRPNGGKEFPSDSTS